jgi:hypothetical protein
MAEHAKWEEKVGEIIKKDDTPTDPAAALLQLECQRYNPSATFEDPTKRPELPPPARERASNLAHVLHFARIIGDQRSTLEGLAEALVPDADPAFQWDTLYHEIVEPEMKGQEKPPEPQEQQSFGQPTQYYDSYASQDANAYWPQTGQPVSQDYGSGTWQSTDQGAYAQQSQPPSDDAPADQPPPSDTDHN